MNLDKSDHNEIRHLFIKTKDVDPKDPNLIWAVVSTDEVDRYQEVVLPDAFKESLKAFVDNPVVLACHQHSYPTGEPPVIGNVATDTIRFEKDKVDMAILFDDDDLGQKYARKYQKKVMRAFSIGFRGLEGEWKDIEGGRIWIWTKIELLEVSAVAVPANRGALLIAAGFYESQLQKSDISAIKELVFQSNSFVEKTVLDLKSYIRKIVKDDTFECECIECGHKMESETHCNDLKCPKCGGQMRRAERPGPGQNAQLTEIQKQISNLRSFCEEGFDDIKSLYDTDSGRLAERWLGGDSDSPGPAGDKKKAEQIVDILSKILKDYKI